MDDGDGGVEFVEIGRAWLRIALLLGRCCGGCSPPKADTGIDVCSGVRAALLERFWIVYSLR